MNVTDVLEICRRKFRIHMENLDGKNAYEFLPSDDGNYCERGSELSSMYNWLTSFVTGLGPIYFEESGDNKYLEWAQRFEKFYHDKVFKTPLDTMHDLGFLYSGYSIYMYSLTGSEKHREDAVKAADELVKRFSIKGGYIDAWRRMDCEEDTGRAIIDCMMNLPLLLWAWKETGHTIYLDVAVSHADITEKYFIRPDYSVCHSFLFDRKTGKMISESNCCGYSNGSYWARGAGWAIYGFALMGRYLGEKYTCIAQRLAQKYMEAVGDDCVPVWDFALPEDQPALICRNCLCNAQWEESDVKNLALNKDSSAAAIVCCGIIEILKTHKADILQKYLEKTVAVLCSNEYFNDGINVAGILKKQNGQMRYTVYGDYFFVHMLHRYQQFLKEKQL